MSVNPVIGHPMVGPMWRPVFAVFVLAVLIFGSGVYGNLTADRRMAPEVKAALTTQRYTSVAVILDFSPEDFHMKYFQTLGTMGGVEGTTILMRRIASDQVRKLAGEYWIRRIELRPTP